MTGLSWRQGSSDDGDIETEDGRVLARYVYSPIKNHPHFRDVRPLEHDGTLSNSAPWDHRWHHGLWWSWKFIDDVLYWEDHPGFGGARDRGLGRAIVTSHTVAEDDGAVVITETLDWREDDTGRVALRESRSMTLQRETGDDESWFIDWDHTWTSESDVRLDTTPYPQNWWGGYAGLNFRAARALESGEHILASDGRDGRDSVHGAESRWSALFGRADGSGSDDPDHPATGGVAIFDHPDNPGGPSPTYVFSGADEFGFLAAAPLMHGDLIITPAAPHRLRYRTIIFGRAVDAAHLDDRFSDYSLQ